ncbi:hypothetical protein AXXA_16502 [Achromobacter insuavis AXX-A]|uniref:Uncharacterized protein n=1 Tax=Achromobacter insuavis AXX-A TaxID=1003200 RepID=F7T2Y6_9BURK|nr:hypothetical protein AXXA_16502 [Achromobacter insuavis AXX-A]
MLALKPPQDIKFFVLDIDIRLNSGLKVSLATS